MYQADARSRQRGRGREKRALLRILGFGQDPSRPADAFFDRGFLYQAWQNNAPLLLHKSGAHLGSIF